MNKESYIKKILTMLDNMLNLKCVLSDTHLYIGECFIKNEMLFSIIYSILSYILFYLILSYIILSCIHYMSYIGI